MPGSGVVRVDVTESQDCPLTVSSHYLSVTVPESSTLPAARTEMKEVTSTGERSKDGGSSRKMKINETGELKGVVGGFEGGVWIS